MKEKPNIAVVEDTEEKDYNLQRMQCKQEESPEEAEMKQQRRIMMMKDLIKKIRSTGRMDA